MIAFLRDRECWRSDMTGGQSPRDAFRPVEGGDGLGVGDFTPEDGLLLPEASVENVGNSLWSRSDPRSGAIPGQEISMRSSE